MPPTLPPIARVTSSGTESSFNYFDDDQTDPQASRSPPLNQDYNAKNPGFIGGMALQNYRRGAQEPSRHEPPRHEATGDGTAAATESHLSRAKSPPPPIYTGPSLPRLPDVVPKAPEHTSSFVMPTDRQQFPGNAAGKRPPGMRIATESSAPHATTPNPEPPKGRKGLPFLKKPMSTLLMRRKTQNAPDLVPLPLASQTDQPSYDPRIMGTRVHDFSAPRPRKANLDSGTVASRSTTQSGSVRDLERFQTVIESADDPAPPRYPSEHNTKVMTSESTSESVRAGATDLPSSPPDEQASIRSDPAQRDARRFSLDKPLPKHPSPPASADSSSHASASNASSISSGPAPTLPKSVPSTRTANSRNVSLSRATNRESAMSALPKHMQSTSSRFSFDMIGAAKQEKLLEERHRQRELERKSTVVDTGPRDSRFDDFDDDGFDYDAMMDDDGLEERIPGINADAEDEEDYELEMDPDDDQENFAGFVFQRSNPQSSLASPYTPGLTPRDANGTVIGFAMTKDTTPGLPPTPDSHAFLSDHQNLLSELDNAIGGLCIQGPDAETQAADVVADAGPNAGLDAGADVGADVAADVAAAPEQHQTPHAASAPRAPPKYEDDIYFDDGLADELTFEHDGTKFDESIFDINDTDRYGRPIPGAFAKAQSLMAAKREATKRESDSTSRLSAQSIVSPSTAHTSLSVDLQPPAPTLENREQQGSVSPQHEVQQPEPEPAQVMPSTGPDMVYQAALAEAAQMAAASGKFRRGSSPTPPADLTVTSPTDSSDSRPQPENPLDDYEVDDFSQGMDDYEVDDDAIIAEANADALANDYDGFYGQEFGFYSTPVSQSYHGHSHLTPSSSASSTLSKSLSAENLYEYSNGGFFGPSGGVNRSTSGRIVSREPNLTPITERSEYSNRNSMMSLPNAMGSGGCSSGPIQSPGLAQLAMMADDDNISLSALLRLRSKAWGGSQASLASSREGSPMSDRGSGLPGDGGSSPLGAGSGLPGLGSFPGHARKNSSFSLWSNSDAGSGAGSPTLTMSMAPPLLQSSPPQIPAPAPGAMDPSSIFPPPAQPHRAPSPTVSGSSCPPVLEAEEAVSAEHFSPTATGQTSLSNSGLWMTSTGGSEERETVASPPQPQHARPSGKGHRHKGSADSISYIKEEDSGETRWVMERRRTADTGEVQLLERGLVEGGHI